jgi:hypothetical protein
MLQVKKNGIIKGGDLELSYNPDDESLSYWGHVKIGLGPIVKKISFNETYKISRDKMRSDSLFVGKKIEDEGVVLTVLTVHDTYAVVNFDSADVDGILTVSTAFEYLTVTQIKAEGKVKGYQIKIEANRI